MLKVLLFCVSALSIPLVDCFYWGTSSSAYQIEGAAFTDGKGPSIWDNFTHQEGRVLDGTNGDVACNFYELYEDDLDLMASLGYQSFRLSISWPRILPRGTIEGGINQKGVEFYLDLFKAMRERNIEPFVTLFHFDLPQTLEDKY